jgi:hypothetical protein
MHRRASPKRVTRADEELGNDRHGRSSIRHWRDRHVTSIDADADLAPGPRPHGVLAAQRSRLAIVGVLCGYFALLGELGGYQQWGKLGVGPSMGVRFPDLRNLTAAWDCTRKGIAVLPVNPCDFDNRPANYPRLWLVPYHLGLDQGDTYVLGLIVGSVFLVAAVAVLPGRTTWWETAIYAFALCSSAAMLGVERGNVDLVLFGLVALAVLVSRRGVLGLVVADTLVLVAACLKLFPIFALGYSVPHRSRLALLAGVIVVVLFGAYLVAIHHQLDQIRAALPQEDNWSYGLRRVSKWISAAVEGSGAKGSSLPSWDVLLLVTMTAGAWLVARRTRRSFAAPSQAAGRRDLDLFWAGACVYVGTYAIARNYDYRLVFCLLTIPQLCRWSAARSKLAWLTLTALLATMWLDGYYTWFVSTWLTNWSTFTAVGPRGQTLSLAAIAQFILAITLLCFLATTAPSLTRRSLRGVGTVRAPSPS